MKVKEKLELVGQLQQEIIVLEHEVQRLKFREANPQKIADLIYEITKKKDMYLDEYAGISRMIFTLQNSTQRTLMRLRYLHRLKWADVCEKMEYSLAAVHSMHRMALEEMDTMNGTGVHVC